MELVVASTNMHKVRELRSLLRSLHFDLLSLRDFPSYLPPKETGKTLEENVRLKAHAAAKALKKWVLADDSGLVVPALQGLPGVNSSCFAGEGATDLENRKKLLSMMQGLYETQRQAYFECYLCLVSPEGKEKLFHGKCEGYIVEVPRGAAGFGYDAIFRKHEYSKTFAELDEEVKNKISHRRKAFDRLLPYLESLAEYAVLD